MIYYTTDTTEPGVAAPRCLIVTEQPRVDCLGWVAARWDKGWLPTSDPLDQWLELHNFSRHDVVLVNDSWYIFAHTVFVPVFGTKMGGETAMQSIERIVGKAVILLKYDNTTGEETDEK